MGVDVAKIIYPLHKRKENIMNYILDSFALVIIFILIIVLGLIAEKSLHQNYSSELIVTQFKRDVKKILKSFIKRDYIRYNFDVYFLDELRGIVKEYANPQFDIGASPLYEESEKVPCISVCFVPQKTASTNEYEDIANLILLKFRTYITALGYRWRSFVNYVIGKDYIYYFIYYEELPEDKKGFEKKYQTILRLNGKGIVGMVEDESLNAELESVS